MSTSKEKLKRIDILFEEFKLEDAFNLLNEVIADEHSTQSEIAEALNWKGVIVGGPAPYLTECEEDETGLFYFIRGFKYDCYQIGILLNIIHSFNDYDLEKQYVKKQKEYFIKAYDILKNELYSSLSDDSKEMLKNYADKYQQFKHETS